MALLFAFAGRSLCVCPLFLGRCPTFPAMLCAWPGWVPRYLVRLSGPPTPNPWRWWSCSVSSPWPRGRRCTTGTPLTTPTMPSWRNFATLASTGNSWVCRVGAGLEMEEGWVGVSCCSSFPQGKEETCLVLSTVHMEIGTWLLQWGQGEPSDRYLTSNISETFCEKYLSVVVGQQLP